jgi:UDP-N-acetyl-2-amino-2-deoxyglucuronate dehydrogenase
MTANTLNVAVIGCGRISGHHCRSITSVGSMRMAAVCDLVPEKAEAYSREFGIQPYTDYRRMLTEHPEIDIVAVATPSGMHFEHGIELLERWGKHLIMEKPTFMRPEQLAAAFGAADRLGKKVFPVFQNRYNHAVQRVKRALDQGELGDIRVVSVRTRWCRPQRYYDLAPWRGTFSHDGGALTNQGIHHVDLLRYLGGDVARVSATMRTLGAEIEVEDTVVATFAYPTGAVGNLEVTTAARPDDFEASLSIVGSKGLAQIGGIAVNELQVFTPDPSQCALHSEDFSACVYGNGHAKMYQDIADCLFKGAAYPVSRADALATLKLLHAFYRSDEAKGGWVDPATPDQSVRLGRADDAISDLYRTPGIAP